MRAATAFPSDRRHSLNDRGGRSNFVVTLIVRTTCTLRFFDATRHRTAFGRFGTFIKVNRPVAA
jgi:hypothetical protein